MGELVGALLGLLAAATFAASAVLQQNAARTAPSDESMRPALLLDLVRRGSFLVGIGALVVAYLLEATAFAFSNVAFVEPIIVTELVFALPIAMRLERQWPGRREWFGVGAVVLGVSAFLFFAHPSGGDTNPGALTWALVAPPCGFVVALLVVASSRRGGLQRALVLSAASGVSFGVLAVVTKSATLVLDEGVARLFASWQPYTLVALGIFAMLLAQSAYQAAPLAESLPVIDALEPVVAVVLSAVAFRAHLDLSLASLVLECFGALLALLGIFLLGRSPLVLRIYESERRGRAKRRLSTPDTTAV